FILHPSSFILQNPRPMRLLFLSNVFPNPLEPHKGTFNRSLVRTLSARHVVRVVSPVAWTIEMAARMRRGERFDREAELDGIPVEYPRFVYPPKVLRQHYGRFLWQSIGQRLAEIGRRFRPQAVVSYWAHPDGEAAQRLARQLDVPAVAMVGGSDVLCLARGGPRRKVILRVLARAEAVVAVSYDLARRLAADGITRDRLHVVYRGVETAVFHPGDRREARRRLGLDLEGPLLIAVGRLVPVKGFDVLIDACGRLAAAGRRGACYVLGDGPQREDLARRSQRKCLGGMVRLAGPQTQSRLADWYRAADLTVLPSFSEGVPNVLLESIACGTPFVASGVGGVPEIADLRRDRLVSAGDAAALAEAIAEQLDRRGQCPPRRFEPLSWEESAGRLTEIIEQTEPSLAV
ncbi:MAG: glycosyltransferase, partial [Vicinamibacterales bacterium]